MGIEIGPSQMALGDRIDFFNTFGGWLNSGGGRMSTTEALANTCDSFSRDEYKAFAPRMERIVNDVHSGEVKIYQAFNTANLGFSRQEMAIIEAAEKSNQLRSAVPALTKALKMKQSGLKQLKGKLTPLGIGAIMLILMSMGVLLIMMPMVMGPTIERKQGDVSDFPGIIAFLWHVSVWLQVWWPVVVAFLVAPPIMFFLRNTPILKPFMTKFLFHFGPSRRLILVFNSTLVVYFMPALVRSGMPLPDVLYTLADTLENDSIAGAMRTAAVDHENGTKLGDALAVLPFKGSFRSAVEAGEATGEVAARVEDLQVPYSDEMERVINRTVSALKGMVMAVLLPLFMICMYTTLVGPIFALMEY